MLPKSKSIQISIPTPCTKSWAGMTPQNGGRHCEQCSKVVTDFTVMTDRELTAFFKDYKGGGCGRFAVGQLDRAITPPAESPHPFWMRALVGIAVLVGIGNASFAQKADGSKASKITSNKKRNVLKGQKANLSNNAGDKATPAPEPIVGYVTSQYIYEQYAGGKDAAKTVTISGYVYDDKGEKMPDARIQVSGLSQSTVTNDNGEFSLDLPAPLQDRNDTLLVQSFDYSVHKLILTDEELAGLKKMEICLPASLKYMALGGYRIVTRKHTPWQRFKRRVNRLFR